MDNIAFENTKKVLKESISTLKESIILGKFLVDDMDKNIDSLKKCREFLNTLNDDEILSPNDSYELRSLTIICITLLDTYRQYRNITYEESVGSYLDDLIFFCNSKIIEFGSSISEVIEISYIDDQEKASKVYDILTSYITVMNCIIWWNKYIPDEDNNKESFLKIIDLITTILTDFVNNKEKVKYLFVKNEKLLNITYELIDIYSDIVKSIVLNNMEKL